MPQLSYRHFCSSIFCMASSMAFPSGVRPPSSMVGAVKFMASTQSEEITASSLPKALIMRSWTLELASISSFSSVSRAFNPALSCLMGSPRMDPEQSRTSTQGVLSFALSANSTYGIISSLIEFSSAMIIPLVICAGKHADIRCPRWVRD